MPETPPENWPEAERWRRQSKHDLDDARFASGGGRHALACFLAQQCAEKSLVAYLYARGADAVWGHALADLCTEAMAFDRSFDLIKSVAILLDKYYAITRYPTALPGGIPWDAFDARESARAIEIARDVDEFIDARLKELKGP